MRGTTPQNAFSCAAGSAGTGKGTQRDDPIKAGYGNFAYLYKYKKVCHPPFYRYSFSKPRLYWAKPAATFFSFCGWVRDTKERASK